MGKIRASIAMLILFSLIASPFSPWLSEAEAELPCCDANSTPYYLLGEATESGKGTMSPFDADLGIEHEAWVTSSVSQLTEIARWRIPQSTTGDYPTSTWRLTVNYEVANAAGVQANLSAEVKIGSKSFVGFSNTDPAYTPAGDGLIEIPIDIDEAGTIHSSGELVLVILSVQTLIINSPGDDAGVRFVWGTNNYPSELEATLPLVEMQWEPAVVNGKAVQFPIILKSGFGSSIWEKVGGEFKVDGIIVETVTATVHDEGAQVYLNWQAPDSAEDGVYEVNLTLDLGSGSPLTGGHDYPLVFGEGGANTGGIFPSKEPLRSGGSVLSVDIDADFEAGDRIKRTTTLEFSGPMAAWFRWGLDNIGNDSLDSVSQWRSVESSSSTEASRNNHMVDEVEVQALENHLSGRASNLKRFMFDGLMIDPGRVLGVEPIVAAAAPSVKIELGNEYGFSSKDVTVTISSLENIKVGEKRALFDNFLRAQASANPIWAEVTVSATLTTSMMVGTAAVDGSGIDYSHFRTPAMERISVPAQTLSGEDDLSDYSVSFMVGDLTHSPLISFLVSLALCLSATMFSFRLTKEKPRGRIYLASAVLASVFGYGYLFALPIQFLTAGLALVSLILVSTAIITPKSMFDEQLTDEAAFLTILPARGRRKSRAINCPKCGEELRVPLATKPYRVVCDGCDTRLKIS